MSTVLILRGVAARTDDSTNNEPKRGADPKSLFHPNAMADRPANGVTDPDTFVETDAVTNTHTFAETDAETDAVTNTHTGLLRWGELRIVVSVGT